MAGTHTTAPPSETTRIKMRAAVHRIYGPPDVIETALIEKPAPGPDELLVRVEAAGVNWADWSITTGMPYVMRAGYGLRRPRSTVRGSDVAGVIEAMGDEVDAFETGDPVVGWCSAAFAEYVTAPAGNFVTKPESTTFAQAACVPMCGMVALQALRDIARVEPDQKVLVNGASGGIGTFAVQIAKALGTEVTGVCSPRNLDLVRSLGADHVIDYTTEDFTQGSGRYDVILDIPDNHSLTERRRVLTKHGTLIPNSGRGGPWFGSIGRIVRARFTSMFVSQSLHPFLSLPKHADLEAVVAMIEQGEVSPVVDRVFPLERAGEAVAYVGAGHTRGKVVVTV